MVVGRGSVGGEYGRLLEKENKELDLKTFESELKAAEEEDLQSLGLDYAPPEVRICQSIRRNLKLEDATDEQLRQTKTEIESQILRSAGDIELLYKLYSCKYLLAYGDDRETNLERLKSAIAMKGTGSRSIKDFATAKNRFAYRTSIRSVADLLHVQLEPEFVKLHCLEDEDKMTTLYSCIAAATGVLNGEDLMGRSRYLADSAHKFSGAPHRGKQALGVLLMAIAPLVYVAGIIAISTFVAAGVATGPLIVPLIAVTLVSVAAGLQGCRMIYENRRHGLCSSFFDLVRVSPPASSLSSGPFYQPIG